jgi:hypothetical protein
MPINRNNCDDAREFHHNLNKNADGTCERWRRNGKTKTWSTRPGEFQIPVKHGLRDFAYITNWNASNFHFASECPT